jgi:hypothetical protein
MIVHRRASAEHGVRAPASVGRAGTYLSNHPPSGAKDRLCPQQSYSMYAGPWRSATHYRRGRKVGRDIEEAERQ